MQLKRYSLALPGLLLALILMFVSALPAAAQRRIYSTPDFERANQGTVGIIAGGFGSTDLRIVADLATVLNEKGRLRLLPTVGQGSVQNIDDILYLRGVDVGVVQSDVFAQLKKQPEFANIDKRVSYIAKLFNVEFHLLARDNIKSVADLAGKKVSFGVEGSGTSITAAAVFDALKIGVQRVNLDFDLALQQLKAGEIDAIADVSGKPASNISQLRADDGLHLVPVEYIKELRADYYPAFFTSGDYPALIMKGDRVPSVSVGTILAVYNWANNPTGIHGARGQKVAAFIDAFFSRYQELAKGPRHPKWREMNIGAEVPGWTRYQPAQQRLDDELKKKNGT
jgi:TRAP transporter TAXI family solute receptor